MLTKLAGPILVVLFALSQAFRDVYFANVFQGIDFFLVIFLTFAIAAVIFACLTAVRAPHEFSKLRRERTTVVWMNVTTALAWTSYFFGLKHLQPSIVNTLHSGMGPLTVIALSALGLPIAQRSSASRLEYGCYGGLAVSLALLWWVVLSGRSGLAGKTGESLLALALLLVSGSSITISLLLSKRLNERGIGADAVTASRYLAIVALAVLVEACDGNRSLPGTTGQWITLAVAATILIVLPTYALQAGVARTQPLTAHVIRALGPAFVFALELWDGRIVYSGPALIGIAAYSAFAIASNAVRLGRG